MVNISSLLPFLPLYPFDGGKPQATRQSVNFLDIDPKFCPLVHIFYSKTDLQQSYIIPKVV